MIPVTYKVRGDHQIIHVGVHKRLWQLQGSHIPYKVWGTIRVIDSYKVPTFHIRYEGTKRVTDSYKVPTFHIRYEGTKRVIDNYKVPASHIRYGGTISHWQLQGSHIPYKVWGTIRVIDSDKVPKVESYHTCGGWHILAPEDEGL